jgi:hypothetical protein
MTAPVAGLVEIYKPAHVAGEINMPNIELSSPANFVEFTAERGSPPTKEPA